MKKIILLTCVFTLIFAFSCSHDTIDAVAEVNENMNLPFPITLAEEDLEYGDEFEKGMGFGCYTLDGEDIQIWMSGWPDVQDSYHVTEYRFTSNKFNVFDISLEDALDDAMSVLKKQGYVRDKEEESWFGDHCYIFKKNNQVKITLKIDEKNNIHEIWITAIATNENNVVF